MVHWALGYKSSEGIFASLGSDDSIHAHNGIFFSIVFIFSQPLNLRHSGGKAPLFATILS